MKTIKSFATTSAAVVLLTSLATNVHAQEYNLIDLSQSLDGPFQSWGTDINSSGQITGTYLTDEGFRHLGFVWDGGEMSRLWPQPYDATVSPPLVQYPYHHASALALNDDGLVVGTSLRRLGRAPFQGFFADLSTPDDVPHLFATHEEGLFTLGITDVSTTSPLLVVGRKRIVDALSPTTGRYRGYTSIIDPAVGKDDSTFIELGTLGGESSTVHGVNDSWTIVGGAETSESRQHAYLSRDRTTLVDLGTLGGRASEALDINESEEIVGWSEDAGGYEHAFLYTGGQMQDLGTLGGPQSRALAISDAGDVVGTSTTADGRQHAFLWRAGEMIDLDARTPAAGWELTEATGVNAAGQIVGWGRAPDGSFQAFLLEPFELTILAPAPGVAGVVNTIRIDGATPGGQVMVFHADERDYASIPGCSLGILLRAPLLLGIVPADGGGTARLQIPSTVSAAGLEFHLQALDYQACRVSQALFGQLQ